MKVSVSLPFAITLRDCGDRVEAKLYLEWPRIELKVDLTDSWNYYFHRGLQIRRNGQLARIILKPIELTLFFSTLKNGGVYCCEGLEKFLRETEEGVRSELACSKGLLLYNWGVRDSKGPFLKTRIDALGPRLKARRSTLDRTR